MTDAPPTYLDYYGKLIGLDRRPDLRVLAGGAAFGGRAERVRALGADFCASTAHEVRAPAPALRAAPAP